MADSKIKITGDVTEIKKSLLGLAKDVKDLGKSKVAIFDREEKDFLSKEAHRHMANIKKAIQANTVEIKKSVAEQSKSKKTLEEEVRVREKVTKLLQKQVSLQKEMKSLQDATSDIMGPGAPSGGGILGKLKGPGGLLAKMGIGGGMLRLLGPIGAAAGAGLFAAGRGRAAVGTFRGGVEDRISLRGRGVSDMALEDRERASRAGLSAQTMRRARLTALDVFGRAGSTQQAVLQRAEVERNYGLEVGTFSRLGAQIRGQLGGEGASKAMMTVQASLMASGITDAIGPYLETTANMLTSLNESGFTFNDSALAVLNNMAAAGMAPERAGRVIVGVDQAIRRSTGEQNAIFQQIFSKAKIGGGTVGGIQAAIRSGGLFGAKIGATGQMMGGTDIKAFKQLGMGGRTAQRVAASAMEMFDKMFGKDEVIDKLLGPESTGKQRQAGATRRLQRLNFIMNTFGLESEVQGAEVNQMLRKMANPKTDERDRAEIRQKIQQMQGGNTELGNLKIISKSTAGTMDAVKNLHETIKDEFGNKLGPVFTTLDRTMMKLDVALSGILDFFGIETAGTKLKEALGGKEGLTQETFDVATGGSKKRQAEISRRFTESLATKKARLGHLKAAARGGSELEVMRLQEEISKMEGSAKGVRGLDVLDMMTPIDRGAVKKSSPMGVEDLLKDLTGEIRSSNEIYTTPVAGPAVDQTKILQSIDQKMGKNIKANEKVEKTTRMSSGVPSSTGRT